MEILLFLGGLTGWLSERGVEQPVTPVVLFSSSSMFRRCRLVGGSIILGDTAIDKMLVAATECD